MTASLLLLSIAALLACAALGVWIGLRMGRSEGTLRTAEAQQASATIQQDLQTQLALERQASGQLRSLVSDRAIEVTDLKSQLLDVSERFRLQSADLQAARVTFQEREERNRQLANEIETLKEQLTNERRRVELQGPTIGQVGILQTSLQKLQEDLHAREGELAQLRQDLSDKQARLVELETTMVKDQEALAQERKQLQEGRQVFRQEFENLAHQIFESKHQTFDAQSKDGLSSLLTPFKEQLESFRSRIDQLHADNIQGHASLRTELGHLRTLNQQITEEASNLTRALKGDKKLQGNWGEQKVELLLEQAGLRKGIEYGREQNFKDEEGHNARPDFVVNLPEGKHIIIDSKVSLVDYANAVAAETPEERQRFLAGHVAALRSHIRGLADKQYPELLGMDSPDFTFLFIAIEPAYLLALEHTPALFQEAYERRIVLVTATTLLPVLRVVANLWSLQRQNQSTLILAEQASRVYDKLRIFIEKMEKLGGQLDLAQRTFKDSFDTLKDGRGSLTRTVEKFVDLGVKVTRKLPASVTGGSLPELGISEAPNDLSHPETS